MKYPLSDLSILSQNLKIFLDEKVEKYNNPAFIENDPISIAHLFSKKQDIEIAGLFAAVLAWGQRKTIINKCMELIGLMDHSPYDFIKNNTPKELISLGHFKHRTFNSIDLMYFIEWLNWFYQKHESLEMAFTHKLSSRDENVGKGLKGFHDLFFSLPEYPHRTKKHIPTPERGSACKRINMFLRWMVRKDTKGVDFGIWTNIKLSQLICPLDLHVQRVAVSVGLLDAKSKGWKAALELTSRLREMDPIDPVKYDFALFNLGVSGEM